MVGNNVKEKELKRRENYYNRKKVPQKLEGGEEFIRNSEIPSPALIRNTKINPESIVRYPFKQFEKIYFDDKMPSLMVETSFEKETCSQYKRIIALLEKNNLIKTTRDKNDSKLEAAVSELRKNKDIHEQIQCSAKLILEIRRLLSVLPKKTNNYKRQLLLLLHGAVKRHYSKKLFNTSQLDIFSLIAKECKKDFVAEEDYFYFDEKIYEADLEVIPAWE